MACECPPKRGGKGKGTPGGMIKVTDFVIVRVPFPRKLDQITAPGPRGVLERRGVVRYLFAGQWLDASSLLLRWQPWRDVVVAPSDGPRPGSSVPAVAINGPGLE